MREELVKTIQGYAKANALMEIERMERLARMTPEEARSISQELTAGWETLAESEKGLERLDSWRAETLVAVRHAFMQLAKAKGWV